MPTRSGRRDQIYLESAPVHRRPALAKGFAAKPVALCARRLLLGGALQAGLVDRLADERDLRHLRLLLVSEVAWDENAEGLHLLEQPARYVRQIEKPWA